MKRFGPFLIEQPDHHPGHGSPVIAELIKKQRRTEQMIKANYLDQYSIPLKMAYLSMGHYIAFHAYIDNFKN